jgi:hypothetical protein
MLKISLIKKISRSAYGTSKAKVHSWKEISKQEGHSTSLLPDENEGKVT